MSEKYTIYDLQDVAKGVKNPPNCDSTMQVRVLDAKNGVANGIWDVDEKFLNGHKVVMGGFISAAVDIMMAYAIASILTNKEGFASINLNTVFHRPAFQGEVEITSTVKRRGRTLAYLEAEVKQKDKIVANCVSSIMISSL